VLQAEVAERIKARLASAEHVRYANSGTEAMMIAIRAARAFTGRSGIVKARGGYHGFWEQLQMAPGGAGVPAAVDALVSDHHFNDVDDLRAAVEGRDDLAAIVVEPVMTAAGVIEGDPAYLAEARRLATEHGALLVLDEIVTLRLAPTGWQGVVGVRPDLTTLGKIIGGGLPVGAVAGRADVLAVFDPTRPGHVVHSGTFNGNAMTLAAGRASLDGLTPDEIVRINGLGARLADSLRAGLPGAVVTQVGSILQVHVETGPVIRRYADTNMASPLLARFHRATLEHGVFMAARGLLAVSTAMDEAVVDDAAERLARAWHAAGGA
jgi:glutamate-1-semialdehyde 2,1-aminomutase